MSAEYDVRDTSLWQDKSSREIWDAFRKRQTKKIEQVFSTERAHAFAKLRPNASPETDAPGVPK